MINFTPPRPDATELLDGPGWPDDLVAENLRDMARINRWSGMPLAVQATQRLLADPPIHAPVVLDVATGGADLPLLLLRWAIRRKQPVGLLATDLSPQIVQIAAQQVPPAISLAAADGQSLPFTNKSVDVAICSLALHHLPPLEAVALLAEMWRVSRRGVVVLDLVRWWPGYWGAWLLTRLISRNPLTRADGPMSVLRAYTVGELRALAIDADLQHIRIRRYGHCAVLTADRRP